jgi:hypothetical protein
VKKRDGPVAVGISAFGSYSAPSPLWPGSSRLSTPATLQDGADMGRPAAKFCRHKLSPLPRSRTFDASNRMGSRDKSGPDALSWSPIPTTNS